MYYVYYFLTCIILGILFGYILLLVRRNSTSEIKSNFIKLDDKNYIVNNEFISFEEDTPLLRWKQEQEDLKHYRAYESERLIRDRETIYKDWIKTVNAIKDYPQLKKCITDENLNNISEKYIQYIKMCDKLEETIRLTKEEFLIKETYPHFCIDWSCYGLFIQKPLGGYYIHNQKTAKYVKGDMRKKIQQEFKEKWY